MERISVSNKTQDGGYSIQVWNPEGDFCLALFLFFLLSSHQANKMNCLEIARKFNESVSARGCSLMENMYATIV